MYSQNNNNDNKNNNDNNNNNNNNILNRPFTQKGTFFRKFLLYYFGLHKSTNHPEKFEKNP